MHTVNKDSVGNALMLVMQINPTCKLARLYGCPAARLFPDHMRATSIVHLHFASIACNVMERARNVCHMYSMCITDSLCCHTAVALQLCDKAAQVLLLV